MIIEKLLFAVHEGSVGSHRAGIIMAGHCLPLACSHSTWEGHGVPTSPCGFYALWESLADVEEFFLGRLGFGPGIESGYGSPDARGNGLYVYELAYEESIVSDDDDSWEWLQGGILRRPTVEELEPLTRGAAPWGGVVL